MSSKAPKRIRHLSLRESARTFLGRQDPVTFGVPVAVFALFFAARLAVPTGTAGAVEAAKEVVLREFGWLFLGLCREEGAEAR